MTSIRVFSLSIFLLLLTFNKSDGHAGLTSLQSEHAQHWVDSVMNILTLRERIAQLFMVAAYSNRDISHTEEIAGLVEDEGIGGLCFFQGGPGRQVSHTNYYQGLAKIPLLISMDAEWGLGMRLDSTISYPRQMMLGALDDARMVYHMGVDIARQLRRIGVHVNFAPVVDINNNPDNPVINTRAFGEEKDNVTQKGIAYMLGLQDNGVLACAKHFPGHGDTDSDSHYTLPLLKQSPSRLDSLELYPFRGLVSAGVAGVMTAHLEVPSLEPQPKLAASLSKSIVSDLLQGSVGFNGLIFTDALNMRGVSDYYKPAILNLMALQAGNDIVLFPSQVKASISRIEREVKSGRFPEEEINRKCRKVIEAKYRVGLSQWEPIETKNLVEDLNQPASELLIRQLTEAAITVVSDSNELIPIVGLDTVSIAYIKIGPERGVHFREQLELYAPITTFVIDRDEAYHELSMLSDRLKPFNLVIIGHHALLNSPNRNYGMTESVSNFISAISQSHRVILNLFGTPYSVARLTNPMGIDALVVAYDNAPLTQSLTAQALFGGTGVSGRLPVSIPPYFEVGAGVDRSERIRLKYSIPEEVGIPSRRLNRIDSIANNAIMEEAAPGMQILAAKDGVVFYNKTFGHFTYTNSHLPVEHKSVYDVASLTKIATTLPVLMDMYSKGQIALNDPLGKYLNMPDTSDFKDVILQDILLHQAGFQAWIPFYQRTLVPLFPNEPLMRPSLSSDYPFRLGPRRYMNKNITLSSLHFNRSYSFSYPIEVAQGVFACEGIKDSIFHWILKSPIDNPGKYLYSDLGFIILNRLLGDVSGIPMEIYAQDTFYSRLGMSYTGFRPLNWMEEERIVPTENDLYFRKQLLWGHVHDPAAAMMGGIAGHAGLFSTANDLAKLMQTYLNGGVYGGERYLPEETITLFTSCINCHNGIRRGMGFDKPEPDPNKVNPVSDKATSLSYGHSGFTGGLVWNDPVYNLTYVFLSNRIHPDAENRKLISMSVRTKIQDALYEAIGAEEWSK